MGKISLDHCVNHVSDWERSSPFYRDVMGAELVKAVRGAGMVNIRLDISL